MMMSEQPPWEFRNDLREWLRDEYRDGRRFVKSNAVAEELDVSTEKAGINLGILKSDGMLEVWSNGGNAVTWVITGVDE
jgi:Mn-dependent DtxR family transcriptional regulator